MRVSTALSQQLGLRTMSGQEAKLLHTMQQLGSGRRVLTPADDPLAAAQTVNVSQSEAMNTRFGANRGVAEQNLRGEEHVLNTITLALGGINTRIVEAGNGSYSDADRLALANVLRETYQGLLGNANATDGNGQYFFSGDRGNVAPYDDHGVYQGNDGQRLVQVAQTRQMPTSDVGTTIFSRAAPGTQTYVAEAAAGNTGTGAFGKAEIMSAGASGFGQDFSVDFEDNGGVLEYTITQADGTVLAGPLPYDPEAGLNSDANGVRFSISGVPADGDSFTFTSAANLDESNFNVFQTLTDLIAALEAPSSGDPVAGANLANALATASLKINLHLDNVLTVRASVGARMNELDALSDEGSNRSLNYRAQLSALQDVDYREAASLLSTQHVALQAAELAYMKTQGLGLFSRG